MRNRRARVKIATREEKREAEEKKMRLFFWGGGEVTIRSLMLNHFTMNGNSPPPIKTNNVWVFKLKSFGVEHRCIWRWHLLFSAEK